MAEYGGGIQLRNCIATLREVDFRNNGSGVSGGAVYADNSDLTYTTGTLEGNHSGSTGGALYLRHSTATLRNLVAINNASGASGGAIYQYGGDVDLGFSTLAANTGAGATVFAQSAVSTDTHHSIIVDSNQYGLYVSTSTSVSSRHNLFYDNQSAASLPSSLSSTSDHVLSAANFVAYDPISIDTYDLHLRWDSPAIDAGDSAFSDPDGTVADIGAFAGSYAPVDFDIAYEDADSDGMADLWEDQNGLDSSLDDSASDLDGDGLTNEEEFLAGSSPSVLDSDEDGVEDADEVDDGTDPADPGEYRPTANAGLDSVGFSLRHSQTNRVGFPPIPMEIPSPTSGHSMHCLVARRSAILTCQTPPAASHPSLQTLQGYTSFNCQSAMAHPPPRPTWWRLRYPETFWFLKIMPRWRRPSQPSQRGTPLRWEREISPLKSTWMAKTSPSKARGEIIPGFLALAPSPLSRP